jgi:pyruvate dehydrogenase E2 component (dihydrolipoamide acetyltransferase)
MAKENILLPAMSDQMSDAEILSWKVSVGDKVNKGDVVCEISTDKVDMDLESPYSGEITNLIATEGDMVNVGETVAEIETEEDSLLGSIFD